MTISKSLLRIVFVGAAFVGGCATAPRTRAEPPPRVADSAPDKVAAQRSAAGLHLEEEDDRWGLTAARDLRQREKKTPQKKAQQQAAAPATVAPTSVDLQKPAPAAP
jgi:hypothetical protein